jgi:hypothetical protein
VNDTFDFVVMLHRRKTDTKIRWIEQFNPVNTATGQFYSHEEFGEQLRPYAEGLKPNYPDFDVYIYLATNEDIAELAA